MDDELCDAEVTPSNTSSYATSIVTTLPLDARSHDPKLEVPEGKIPERPGSSLRSKCSDTCHVGGENVSPNQNFSNVAFEEPDVPKFLNVNTNPMKASQVSFHSTSTQSRQTSQVSFRSTSMQSCQTNQRHQDDNEPRAVVDLDHIDPRSIHLPTTSLNNDGRKDPLTTIADPGWICGTEGEFLGGQSLADQCSSTSRSSTFRNKNLVDTSNGPHNFRKIMSSIHPSKTRGPQQLKPSEMRQDLGDEFEPYPQKSKRLEVPQQNAVGHRKTSSGLSAAFFGAIHSVKSAGPSSSVKADHSQASRSRWSRLSNRSSNLSDAPHQVSRESDFVLSSASHKATTDRGLQRRRILGELISSETGYISDLKILAHVCL